MSPQEWSCFVDNHNQIQTICYFYIKRGLALLFLLNHIEQANQCFDTELIGGLDKKITLEDSIQIFHGVP